MGNKKVIESYFNALDKRGYKADEAQEIAIKRLQKLHDDLYKFKASAPVKKGFLSRIFQKETPTVSIKGVYFWGGVGRGKSFIMDSFYQSIDIEKKVRIHFHEFMQSVHQHLQEIKDQADPLDIVAQDIASRYRLICFDEFHVSDIADAMILYRLLSKLFEQGCVFVMTSNYKPSDLYPDGLHRDRLLPAIKLICERMDILNIDTGVDYRQRALEQVKRYYYPLNTKTSLALKELFSQMADKPSTDKKITVNNRSLQTIAEAGSVVWFDFDTLCMSARSQNDYIELATRYNTVFLSDVPKMSSKMASAARRFTWLIDVLYDFKVKLIMSAECEAEELYTEGVLANEFHRTVSRIVEMQSKEYLKQERRVGVKL